MARTAKLDIESRWYDCFARWPKADREAALKVLATLHQHLPDAPKKKAEPEQAELPGAKV